MREQVAYVQRKSPLRFQKATSACTIFVQPLSTSGVDPGNGVPDFSMRVGAIHIAQLFIYLSKTLMRWSEARLNLERAFKCDGGLSVFVIYCQSDTQVEIQMRVATVLLDCCPEGFLCVSELALFMVRDSKLV